ncbi:MAG: polysaccharide lyase family 1 protein [Pirellulales bacterium]
MRTWLSFHVAATIVLGLCAAPADAQLPAFPGAEGEGRFTSGGRGGDVYHVTNLNDSGPGSLRQGLATAFSPRTIVFDVGGSIHLESDLSVTNANVTIAGETAPAQGIALVDRGLGINAPNVIMRHVRVRPGDAAKGPAATNGFNGDAISIWRSDVILDHVSASWGIDENLSIAGNGTRRVTVQYSTISEGLSQTGLWHGELNADYNPGGPESHSMGSLIKPTDGNGIVTFHHNLWSNNGNRNPAIGNYSDDDTLKVDLRNNVLFNNRANGYSSGESERIDLNYVGNYVIAGPDTSLSNSFVAFRAAAANNVRIYSADNKIDGNRNGVLDDMAASVLYIQGDYTKSNAPFSMAPVTTQSPDAAYAGVLAGAGAFPWNRDSVDARLVAEVILQDGQIINSQSQVGGYPDLPTYFRAANWDTDLDGMPNWWEEIVAGLNENAADNNGDLDGDGYTNLEEYLHYSALGYAAPEPATWLLLLPGLLVLGGRWRRSRPMK